MMNDETQTEAQTGMVLYAMAQSRDDRTMDIFSSLREGLVSDYAEQQSIMQLIESKAPVSDKKSVVLKAGNNWAAGYLLPDSPGPRGRLRPVQFVANKVSWKTTEPTVFADAVCKAMTSLVGEDELSSTTLAAIRTSLEKLAKRRKGCLGCGCLPISFCILSISVFLWLLF